MKTTQIITASIAVMLVTLIGCKKYEDGPLVSLRSKEARVANDWRIGQAIDNGEDVTDQYEKYDYDITKDGKLTLNANYTFLGSDVVFVKTGTWAFLNNKEKISVDFDDDNDNVDYTILKLENDEMWLKEDDSDLELHFISR